MGHTSINRMRQYEWVSVIYLNNFNSLCFSFFWPFPNSWAISERPIKDLQPFEGFS